MKKKVYISGAIAHYDLEERMAAFGHAARYLSIKGYEPVNPFENGISQLAPGGKEIEQNKLATVYYIIKCLHNYLSISVKRLKVLPS